MTCTPSFGMVAYILMPMRVITMPSCWKPGLTTLPLKMTWTWHRQGSRVSWGHSMPPLPRASPWSQPHLVGHDPVDGPADEHHTGVLVLEGDGPRAGDRVPSIVAEVVVDEHTQVAKHRRDLLHQHVGAVVQERVVGAVEGDVVRVAPAGAHTCGHRGRGSHTRRRLHPAPALVPDPVPSFWPRPASSHWHW